MHRLRNEIKILKRDNQQKSRNLDESPFLSELILQREEKPSATARSSVNVRASFSTEGNLRMPAVSSRSVGHSTKNQTQRSSVEFPKPMDLALATENMDQHKFQNFLVTVNTISMRILEYYGRGRVIGYYSHIHLAVGKNGGLTIGVGTEEKCECPVLETPSQTKDSCLYILHATIFLLARCTPSLSLTCSPSEGNFCLGQQVQRRRSPEKSK